VVALALADSYCLEPQWIEWNEFSLKSRGNQATPIKVVQLSDLHLKEVTGSLRESAQKINHLKPDLICITGDSVDRVKYLPVLEEYMDLIDLAIPKFAILGNWEYWGGINLSELQKIYEKHNCRLLVNDCAVCSIHGKKVLITGVDDFVGGDANLKVALKNFQDTDFHIVLNHCPEYRDFMLSQRRDFPWMDLVLAGHTHGGQINMLGFIPVLPPGSGKYIKGWYRETYPHMYVSRGIGMSVFPVRFGSRPEIPTFHLNV
jgi:predicted MPP superfamily phosphohydrolase